MKSYKAATMHNGTFTTGIGAVAKNLTVIPDGANKAVDSITLEEGSLVVTVVLKDVVGKKVVLDIPLSNFENLRE